jgi:hypothetical protein
MSVAMDIEDAKWRSEFSTSLGAASKDARDNQAFIKAVTKVDELERQARPIVVSVALLLNSLLFAWLVRKKFSNKPWTREAHVVHLYCVGASLAPVVFTSGVLAVIADCATRYDIKWYLDIYNLLGALIGIWALFQLRVAALKIAAVAGRSGPDIGVYSAIRNRLFFSNFISQIVVYT